MEARANGEDLRGGALTTLEAMVVSMGFMAPSVAMFFNTRFIAQFAGADEPDTAQKDVGRREERDTTEERSRRETIE